MSLFGKKRNPPKDCDGHNTEGAVSGVYSLLIDGRSVKVFCDFDSESGRPWTVFQKRKDGSVDFYRGSAEYASGFGDIDGEYWLGLDNIHKLTKSQTYELRIDVCNGLDCRVATYSVFSVSHGSSNYVLSVSGYAGNAGDSLSYHSGRPFTTKDQGGCAVSYSGAWW